MSDQPSLLIRIGRKFWRVLDIVRRATINGLFLLLLIALAAALLTDDTPEVAEETALLIAPKGQLVEQLTGTSIDQLIDEAAGSATRETLLKDMIDAIDTAGTDDRVQMMVLDLNSFGGARLTKLQDVAAAMKTFKASGKKIVALADSLSMDSYYLAAQADEIWVHPMGMVAIEGMGRYRMFYKEGLDKFGVDVNVFKVGTYKSAVEPYMLNGMSDAAKEADREWLGDLWRAYLSDVGLARELSPSAINQYAQAYGPVISEANGNAAQAALDFGLIDATLTRIEMRQRLIDLVGEDEKTHSFNHISMNNYLATLNEDRFGRTASGNKIAVIVARGNILDGNQPAGTIGGDSTARLIRQVRHDDNVKALILRVDSGGGSAFASEVIRREMEAAQGQGIKVIASMGSVAASGGFWISTASDQIWAHPTTITGSIGIFGIIPTIQRPLAEYAGIRVDGITTAPLAGVRIDRALPAEFSAVMQSTIDKGYRDFLQRVAESRDMTTDEVDAVAQGRVWSGEDAHALGLVDNLGNLHDAIEAAAALANLGADYTVSFIEEQLAFKAQILRQLQSHGISHLDNNAQTPSLLLQIMRDMQSAEADLVKFNDPNHSYAWSTIQTD